VKRTFSIVARVILFASVLMIGRPDALGDILLHDFDNAGFGFEYGSWISSVTPAPTYVTVGSPAGEDGGAGFEDLLLDTSDGIQIQVKVRPLVGNTADRFNFILKDSDGTEIGWHFELKELNEDPPEFTVLTTSLVTPHFINSTGINSLFDYTSVTNWQLQGDFSSNEPLRLQFDHLVIIENGNYEVIPEPLSISFLIVGLGSLLGWERVSKRSKLEQSKMCVL